MEYIYQRAEYSRISKDADGKLVGSKSIFTHETDNEGNFKESKREDYDLDEGGKWVLSGGNSAASLGNAKTTEEEPQNEPCEPEAKPAVEGKFKDGDILKAEYPTYNVYAAYLDDDRAHWILITSLNPGKNQFLGIDHTVDFDRVDGVVFNDLQKATRDEVFAVEHFIEANTGYRWDWRNKELVKA